MAASADKQLATLHERDENLDENITRIKRRLGATPIDYITGLVKEASSIRRKAIKISDGLSYEERRGDLPNQLNDLVGYVTDKRLALMDLFDLRTTKRSTAVPA